MTDKVKSRTAQNDLARFVDKVNALLSGRFIVSDKRIADLLKCILTIPQLIKSAKNTLQDFSYAGEFARNRVVIDDTEGAMRSRISLPVDKVRLFTFVFCLLAEFDMNKRNISVFLSEYFYHEDFNVSFERFCDEIMRPFKRAGEYLLRDIDPDSLDAESIQQGESFFEAEKIYFSSASCEKIVDAVHALTKRLNANIAAGSQAKGEASETGDALIFAVKSRNPKWIRLAWLAFKNTCCNLTGAEKFIEEVRTELVKNNLL